MFLLKLGQGIKAFHLVKGERKKGKKARENIKK
jgi:hypothetical protein